MSTFDPHGVANKFVPAVEYALDRTAAINDAQKHNLNIVDADDYTLQLDFDDDNAYQLFLNTRLSSLISFIPVKRVYWTQSRSGNTHVYIKLYAPLKVEARIALQAALGSDPTREFLNLMRVYNNVAQPVLLFETQDAVEGVIYATDGYQPALSTGEEQDLLTDGFGHLTLAQSANDVEEISF